jgi:methionine-gamma-lyase
MTNIRSTGCCCGWATATTCHPCAPLPRRYGRSFNPTVRNLGRQLAALEGAAAAYCCASGMAAVSATLLALCSAGDHIVCSNAVYGGTFALLKARQTRQRFAAWWLQAKRGHPGCTLRAAQAAHASPPPLPPPPPPHPQTHLQDFLPSKCGITTTFVPIDDHEAVVAAVTPRTRAIYTESLSNPTLVVADIPRLAQIAHAAVRPSLPVSPLLRCVSAIAPWAGGGGGAGRGLAV